MPKIKMQKRETCAYLFVEYIDPTRSKIASYCARLSQRRRADHAHKINKK